MNDENNAQPFVVKVFFWTAPAIVLLLILGFISGGKDIGNAIGSTIGYNIVTAAATIFVFCATDFFKNKTAARLFYGILFAGILYIFYWDKFFKHT